ncbi:MAG: hypothetical protein WD314_03305 [Trueperaceae bacterium]
MKPLIAAAAATAVSVVLAQAPATKTDLEPGLLFDLLGSGNAIELELPDRVLQLFVVGVLNDEALLSLDVDLATNPGSRAVVSAGGLNGVGHCAAMSFGRIELTPADGRGGYSSTSTHCLDESSASRFRGMLVPGPLSRAGHDAVLPFDTWLLFEGVLVEQEDIGPVGEEPGKALLYYIYLNSGDLVDMPDRPTYSTWDEIIQAFESAGE